MATLDVVYYHFYNWPEDFFPRMAFLFELITDVTACRQEVEEREKKQKISLMGPLKRPVVIQCKYVSLNLFNY